MHCCTEHTHSRGIVCQYDGEQLFHQTARLQKPARGHDLVRSRVHTLLSQVSYIMCKADHTLVCTTALEKVIMDICDSIHLHISHPSNPPLPSLISQSHPSLPHPQNSRAKSALPNQNTKEKATQAAHSLMALSQTWHRSSSMKKG